MSNEMPNQTVREEPAGTLLFKEGDPGYDLFLMKEGFVEIFKLRRGREIVLAKIGPGEIFGTLAALTDRRRAASARAASNIKMVVIPGNNLEQVIKGIPQWLQVLIKDLIKSVNHVNELYVTAALKIEELEKNKL